jgi:regulatory protein
MIKREIPEEIYEPILDRFEEAGLINDLVFAQTIVFARRNGRGLSVSAIRRELRTKGVAEELIAEATESITQAEEIETAIKLAVRRVRSMGKLEPLVRKRRLMGFLQRKGYSQHAVMSAIRAAEDEAVKSEF